MFRAYSAERRDRAPLIETEDFRDEAARRFWDDSSPPHFGFKPGPKDTYHWNSETFCLAAAARYHDYFINRISNADPAHSKWSGYASIYWSDSNADGRQDSSEVCRVSGKVDSVRLPKQAYYVYRVMQNEEPDLHIIGHWNYPSNTVKTIYVAANHCDSVELFVNGKPAGAARQPLSFVDSYEGKSVNYGDTGYIYAFPQIKFEAGAIKAVGTKNGKSVGAGRNPNRRRSPTPEAHALHRPRTACKPTFPTRPFSTSRRWTRRGGAARPTKRAWISA